MLKDWFVPPRRKSVCKLMTGLSFIYFKVAERRDERFFSLSILVVPGSKW